MKYTLIIECECGNRVSVTPKRNIAKHENGRVYEDYSSIAEGIEEVDNFSTNQSYPEGMDIICNNCGDRHELTL